MTNSKPPIDFDPKVMDEIVQSDVFYNRYRNEIGKRILFEAQFHDPINVEYIGSAEQFDAILQHIKNVWMKLGEEDPHWSVASAPQFRADKIINTIDQFNNSGRIEVENLKRLLARVGLRAGQGTLLEYGCGVGRVTRWLAEMFPEVIGVDISANHLVLAESYFQESGLNNVHTIRISGIEGIENLPNFDFLYSKIVLQHNPPPVMHRILNILCGKLNSGGSAVLQIPTYCKGYSFSVNDYIKKMDNEKGMEMHVLPQHAVYDILDSHKCRVREVFRDHMITRMDFVSSTIVFEKI